MKGWQYREDQRGVYTLLIREILRFADGVTVLEPPELRMAVREKLEKMVKNYEKDKLL